MEHADISYAVGKSILEVIKMRILKVVPFYVTHIKRLTEALASQKEISKVDVLVRHNYLAELSRILPSSYAEWVKKYTKRNLVDLKNSPENVSVHVVSTLYLIPDGRNWKLGDKLFKTFEKYIKKRGIQFDLIHAHFTWPSGYVAVKLGEKFRVPVVVTAHGFDAYDLPFRNQRWFETIRGVLLRADKIITPSESNMKIITEKLLIDPQKVIKVSNGFSSSFHPINKDLSRERLGLSQNKKIILNVANVVPIKGHRYLIEAMKIVSERRDDILCIIVGGGPLKTELKKKIKKEGLEDKIILVGAKPHDEISLWMNAADLFVLPSLSEGNPTVMFEALGVGLPFVGTGVGGVPEIITSEDYGLLCRPGDPIDLAEKILIALDKEWDREKIRRYAEQFTWDNIAKEILKAYEYV